MKHVILSLAAFALLPTVTAAQLLGGRAAVVNNDVITLAEVLEITAETEAKIARDISGEPLRRQIAKIRRNAISSLFDQKGAEMQSGKVK